MQTRTNCSGFSCRFVCSFCLAQYLAFTDDHRVEGRSNPEKVQHALFGLVAIEWRCVIVRVGIDLAHETTRNFTRGYASLRHSIDLHPVARSQKQRLGAAGFTHDRFSRCAICELLKFRDVCRVMAQTDAEKIHGSESICAVNVIPQRSVNAALKPRMHSAATRFGASQRRWRPCKIAA